MLRARARSLLAHGVGASFDLAEWCRRESCGLCRRARLELLLEQCRPEVTKLFVLEDLIRVPSPHPVTRTAWVRL